MLFIVTVSEYWFNIASVSGPLKIQGLFSVGDFKDNKEIAFL